MADNALNAPVDQLLSRPNLLTHQISSGSSENQSDTSSAQEQQLTSDPIRRKRGRPRKHPPREIESETNIAEATRFIHVSQDGADHDTRRAIRSHAMSAFRRDQREQKRALERASESIAGLASASSLPQEPPMATRPHSALTNFERLPLTIDNTTLELLIKHFGTRRSVELSQTLEDQIQYFRKVDWLPMQDLNFVRSAQLAWIELQSASFTQQHTADTSSPHLLRAFAEINEAIEQLDQMPVESLCYSVALCMSAAASNAAKDMKSKLIVGVVHHRRPRRVRGALSWLRSASSVPRHVDSECGLPQDLSCAIRACTFLSRNLDGRAAQTNPSTIIPDAASIRAHQPPYILQIHTSVLQADASSKARAAGGFYTVLQKSVIPAMLYEVAATTAGLQTLLEHTSIGQITSNIVEELVLHIWSGSCMLYNAQPICLTPLEKACRLSLMIHFYIQLFTAPPVLVDRLILSILRQLRLLLLEMDLLLTQSSELIVWLVSTAGAFAKGNARTQMSQSMKMLQYRLVYGSDVSTLGEVCRTFLWGQYIEEAARRFWTDTASLADDDVGGRSDLLISEDFAADDGDEEADLLEMCELEATVLGLVPVGL